MSDYRVLTEDQKSNILANIQRIEATELLNYINSGQITLEEMKDTGRLNHSKQSIIKAELDKFARKRAAEAEIWGNTVLENSIRSFNEYLQAYPNGHYVEMARVKLEQVKKELEGKKHAIISEIKNNPDDYTPERLEDFFRDGKIKRQDLIDNGIISEKALNLFLNPPRYFMDQYTWKDLNPLPEGKTDVYLFGIPRSGKSCVLAGLFAVAEKRGMMVEDISNKKGIDYKNELIKCIDIGYVPPSTSTDTVNYITCSLVEKNKKGKEREHPLSVVEMSGEFFKRTYENDDTNGDDGIGAKGYLNNGNKKLIYLVIDYFTHQLGSEEREVANQQQLLTYCLNKLEADGTLKKTDSIQLIVTKCDLMPADVDRESHLREFIEDNYLNLINLIKRLNKKYGINQVRQYNAVIHPFSLGKFMLGKTFEFKKDDTEQLLQGLLNLTSHRRAQKPWSKLFK